MRTKFPMAGLALGLVGAAAIASTPTQATVLLDLVNAPAQSGTVYDLTFVAVTSTTTLSVAGYQVPLSEFAFSNGVYLDDAGPNLLGPSWNFTPAASGSLAATTDDGTPVPGLEFAGYSTGYYDTFSQTFATTVGETYHYDFLFYEDNGGPSGFIVSDGAVPEPTTWALMLVGFAGLGAMMRRRARAAVVI